MSARRGLYPTESEERISEGLDSLFADAPAIFQAVDDLLHANRVFTIIGYRTNGVELYRGRVNARSDSEFSISTHERIDDAVKAWFKLLEENHRARTPVCCYDIILLVNGEERQADHPDHQTIVGNAQDMQQALRAREAAAREKAAAEAE